MSTSIPTQRPDDVPDDGPDDGPDPVGPADLRFGPDGLLPVIVRDVGGDVLMLAHMDREALERTLADGTTVFFSRSRQTLWPKGATSGNVQRVVAIATDCDADALLVTVAQTGVACHTGRWTCFHRPLERPREGGGGPRDGSA